MTASTPSASATSPSSQLGRLTRIGGVAALLAAGTFFYGIVMFATTFADYTDPVTTRAESVDFLVGHQGALLAWYTGIFIVFGAALVPLGLALRRRLADVPVVLHAAPGPAGRAVPSGAPQLARRWPVGARGILREWVPGDREGVGA